MRRAGATARVGSSNLLTLEAAAHVAGDLAHALAERRDAARLAVLLLLTRAHEDQRAARAGAHDPGHDQSRPAARIAEGARVPVGDLVDGGAGDRGQAPLEPLAKIAWRVDGHERALQEPLELTHRDSPPVA